MMRFDCEQLISFVQQLAQKNGMNDYEAFHFAHSVVSSDMRGLGSHGLMRLSTYVRRMKEKLIAVDVAPEITSDGTTLLAVDGKNGMGCTVAAQVMDICIQRAKEYGSCFAGVNHSNHFGYAGYFAKQAAKQGMVAVVMTNAAATVAPFGGTKAMFGTNPLCVAIPAGAHEPFLLDMATSLVAQGKLILARKEGRSVPKEWGLDESGAPCTDPARILDHGTLTPFGGVKGYGIALMIELLTVCLSNASKSTNMGRMYDYTREQETGFVLGVLDVSKIMPLKQFTDQVDEIIDEIKASPKAEGVSEIFIPGEIEDRKYEAAYRDGIELSDAIVADLEALGKEYGIALFCE